MFFITKRCNCGTVPVKETDFPFVGVVADNGLISIPLEEISFPEVCAECKSSNALIVRRGEDAGRAKA